MKHFITFSFLILLYSGLFAQKSDSLKLEQEHQIKLSALPYYSFGKGVGITSPDSLFQLNIRFRMQNRLNFELDEDDEFGIGAYIRRLRLRFDGYVGNPKFLYAIQLSFAPDDVGPLVDGGNLNVIRDAIINYIPNKNWSFIFGQTKLPGNRQRINSSGALQLTDRSINNARFNLDRDFGFQIHNIHERKNDFSYNLKLAITSGNGRNTTVDNDPGLSYTGKVELFPLGAFSSNGTFFEGDLKREKKPKLMFSAAYNFNSKALRTHGTLGNYLYEKRDLNSLLLDAMFKHKGLAFMWSYMSRNADNPITVNPEDAGDVRYVFVGHGMDFQSSYLFPNDYELIGRLSTQKMKKSIASLRPNQNQYTLGLTKYIWEHAFKLQFETTLNQYKHLENSDTHDWYSRFQVEIGI